jgi:hypothetical protein
LKSGDALIVTAMIRARTAQWRSFKTLKKTTAG